MMHNHKLQHYSTQVIYNICKTERLNIQKFLVNINNHVALQLREFCFMPVKNVLKFRIKFSILRLCKTPSVLKALSYGKSFPH